MQTFLTKSNSKGCKRCSNTVGVAMTTLGPYGPSVVNAMVLRSSVQTRNYLILKRYMTHLVGQHIHLKQTSNLKQIFN